MLTFKSIAGSFAIVTSFLAATSVAGPVDTCTDPQGVQWAIYPNPFGNQANTYKQFNPTIIKTETPEDNGVTGSIGFDDPYSDDYFYPYGDSEYFSDEQFIMDHRGYLKAPYTGVYNFTITANDNIVIFWVHSNAYSGWTRKNAALLSAYGYTPTPTTYSFRLKKGNYTPIRVVWANNGGPVDLEAQLTDPMGNVLLGSGTPLSSSIVQYGCSGSAAPPFQPYGSEQ